MWFVALLIPAVIIFLFMRGKSIDRKIYVIIVFLISSIFVFRFACSNMQCISNVFLGGMFVECSSVCAECDSLIIDDYSMVVEYMEYEKFCSYCNRCIPDWNIRTASDPAGIVFLGIIIVMIFFCVKDYPIKGLWEGLDAINLFGVLSFKVSQIEKSIEVLSNEMEKELVDSRIQDRISKINVSIHKKLNTPPEVLHSFMEQIDLEYTKVDGIFKEKNSLTSSKKKEQLKKLSEVIENFYLFAKNDIAYKYVNRLIFIAKKILLIISTLLDYYQPLSFSKKKRYLIDNLGVDMIDDEYSIIINKGVEIPIQKTQIYHTMRDNQTSIVSEILIGSNKIASENKIIGEIKIEYLPKLPATEATITILFKIDKLGMLIVKQICNETDQIVQEEFDINEYLAVRSD